LIVAIAWITSNNFENEKIPGLGITRLESVLNEHLRTAARSLRDGGLASLRTMLSQSLDFGRVHVYVLDAERHDLLGREVPPEVMSAIDRAVPDAQGLSAGRMRLRVLNGSDNTKYTAIASFDGPTMLRLLYRHPKTFWMHVG